MASLPHPQVSQLPGLLRPPSGPPPEAPRRHAATSSAWATVPCPQETLTRQKSLPITPSLQPLAATRPLCLQDSRALDASHRPPCTLVLGGLASSTQCSVLRVHTWRRVGHRFTHFTAGQRVITWVQHILFTHSTVSGSGLLVLSNYEVGTKVIAVLDRER